MQVTGINQTQVLVQNQSQFTGRIGQMQINMTYDDFIASYQSWADGALIQDAFPTLSADEREFLLTGCTPEEWAEMFPDS